MRHLKDITVLVLGLGESGLAMARWSARCGATVRVWDSRGNPPNAGALERFVPGARLFTGALPDEACEDVRVVLKSPGLSPTDERIAQALARAADGGALIQGELELFARALDDLKAERGYAPKVVAITGTNGKTTTTSMAALLIERAGRRAAMAGNIGPTMLQTLSDALEQEAGQAPAPVDGPHPDPLPEGEGEGGAALAAPVFEHLPEVWVLELSSFQLDQAKGFEPNVAVMLNITQDHLDWHGSMAAYMEAKHRIFGKQAVLVVNRDDALVEKLVAQATAALPGTKPGGRGRADKPAERAVVRFGLSAPQRPGDYGLVVENGMAWLVRAMEAEEGVRRSRRSAAVEIQAEDVHLQRLMPADALRLRGRHNAANALAALGAAAAIGCPLAPMLHGLREYAGEPHRVEYVASVNGVDAVDDSKGTNVGATVAAIDGLGMDKAPARLVVILGGDGKGQDFTPLAEPVMRHARAVATIGRDAASLEQALAGTGVPLQRHATLEAATRWAFERAHAGDTVLLSPACASLDMFRDYAHRAEVFASEVRALAEDAGEVSA